jgi:6-phospho-beta-glucosidase
MASINIAYIGGGSTRAPGTVASYLLQAEAFAGSTVTLIDKDVDKLELVKRLATRMATAHHANIRICTTTNLEAGLTDADAVLSSFRPGDFEMRYLDESIPLKHGVIGQETQGPGGFFMALRSVHVIKQIATLMQKVAPKAVLFNYTNPVNIVAQAVSFYSDVPVVSLCEGPIVFPKEIISGVGLDPAKLETTMIGLNHACWSTKHLYDGADVLPLLEQKLETMQAEGSTDTEMLRRLEMAVTMRSLPASYMKYYYFRDEILRELQEKPTTRSQDIMADVPDYWQHYAEQAEQDNPVLEPGRSRGGIFELELAVDVMDSFFNNKKEIWTLNVPNRGAISDMPFDRVVEVPCVVGKNEIIPLVSGALPTPVRGLVGALGEYQTLAAKAAWEEDRRLALQALVSNPLVPSLGVAKTLYAEMSAAQADYLPRGLR